MDNAVKFTPAAGSVRVSCHDRDSTIVIEVADTGIGIPREQHAQVFREFKQLNNPERDRSKGLGLGLAIVDRMSALLGHPLTLDSAVGQGTVFSLSVPKALAQPAGPAARPGEVKLRGRVLVVEDDEDVLGSTAALLAAMGAEVRTARTTEQALAESDGLRFDAVLVDYRLPGASGIELLKQAQQRWPGIKTALVTGDPQAEDLLRGEHVDAIIIQKPVSAERLLNLLARMRIA